MKRVSLFVLLCFMLCLFSQMPAPVHATTWWDTDWNYKMKLTIDQTKVDADLTDFPVLVNLTSTRINWAHVQDDLDDIRFVDSTETTVLKAELENYILNNKAWIWVKVPVVDDAVDTDFYMYYGNAGAASAWDAENVWAADAVMVQHMVDATTSAVLDSTANNNDGTKKAANEPIETASGKVDSAQSFDGTNDFVGVLDSASLDIADAVTLVVWMKRTSDFSNFWRLLVGKPIFNNYGLIVEWGAGNLALFNILSGTVRYVVGGAATPLNEWLCVIGTYDRTEGIMRLYYNGTLSNSHNIGDKPIDLNDQPVRIGGEGTNVFPGIIDEVRIYNTAKSAAWIRADYNSGADTLLIYGAESIALTVYYNIGINKLYINGTQTTNGTVVTTFFNKNVNATATVKPNFVFFKHKLTTAAPNFVTPYIWNMTTPNTLWTYAVVGEVAGASSGALIFTGILALIILIPFIWRRRR